MSLIDPIIQRIERIRRVAPENAVERIAKLEAKLARIGVIRLTPRSWIQFKRDAVECSTEQFQEFWNLCPTEHHEIMMFGKLIPIPRFQKLFGEASYKFSGVEMEADPDIPELVERCLEYARTKWPRGDWNGALVNWYPDGRSYIGAHSDDERDLVPGVPILSFSFGGVRTFRIREKVSKAKQDFQTEDCSLLVMGGAMQQEFKHEITKTAKYVGPRINITVRCFK